VVIAQDVKRSVNDQARDLAPNAAAESRDVRASDPRRDVDVTDDRLAWRRPACVAQRKRYDIGCAGVPEMPPVETGDPLWRHQRDGHECIPHSLGPQHPESEELDARLTERRANPVGGDVDDEAHRQIIVI
jgi:hypothetical protein